MSECEIDRRRVKNIYCLHNHTLPRGSGGIPPGNSCVFVALRLLVRSWVLVCHELQMKELASNDMLKQCSLT